METTFVLIVALSVAMMVILILVFTLLYYRWRNTELRKGLGEFLRENMKLKHQIGKMYQDMPEHE